MTVVGEMPAETTEAPKPQPKSRKKFAITGGAVAAAIVFAVVVAATSDGGGAGSVLAPKPSAQEVAKSYLTALSDGSGDDAAKLLDSQNRVKVDMAASTALREATTRIQGVKVGDELGAKPQESGDSATVRAAYTLAGKDTSVDMKLVKGPDGWLIHDPAFVSVEAPAVLAVPGGKPLVSNYFTKYADPLPVDYKVTVGKGLPLTPGKKATLFPAEYPLTYSGSKYFKSSVASFSEDLSAPFIVVNDTLVIQSLQAQLTKYVQDCMASGQTEAALNDQPCGFSSVNNPATVDKIQTDTSDWTLTTPPTVGFRQDGTDLVWRAKFDASAHRVWINKLDPTVGANVQVSRKFSCEGGWDFNAKGEPQYAYGSCDGNRMYALTMSRPNQ